MSISQDEAYVVTSNKAPVWPSRQWKSVDPVSFEKAEAESHRGDGVGVILSETPYVCFDFDDVISEDGEWHPKVLAMFEWMHSEDIPYFAEYSSSVTGIHLFFETHSGELPYDDRKEAYVLDDEPFVNDALPKVEAFDSRHIALTQNFVHGSLEEIPFGEERVEELHSAFEKKESHGNFKGAGSGEVSLEEAPKAVRQIRATLEQSDSEKAKECLALWDGERLLLPDSQNETDASLVARLYFWTGGSTQLTDKCFRTSALYRDKWDDVHYGNGDTYGERLIQKVEKRAEQVYRGRYADADSLRGPSE